ncbi:FAD-binding protein [Microbacterium sp. B2969]|uniref:FAD-binding protein n=1 Tax=Microbacterium alkaliflavum TaxID=3248839 RepID=A0ABW7QAY9_9MICO
MPRNWAGTYEYRAPRIESASTEEDVQRIVREGGPVHALGTRHSFTDLPDTEGTLIDVSGLTGGITIDEDARTVTVAAGTRYGIVAGELDEQGWALHNLGSLPHISVGGATATGTHGSGDANGVLTTAVRGIRYVGADGEVHEAHRGDDDFAALAVGAGAFGILTALTLDIQPAYRARQDIYAGVSWDAALADLDALTGAGYSVSLFTRWEPDTIEAVWVKTRLASDDDAVSDTLLDGQRVVGVEGPLGSGDNITEVGGVPGPWMLRLPHFRLDSEPSFGEEIQTEYFVPRTHGAAALDAVRALGDSIRPHLVWSEIRTAARDDLWLSGAYGQDVVIIHFTWFDRPEEVGALLPPIEEALRPFGARPHWGKVHRFDRPALERVHPRIGDARAVFERLDPEGRFSNAHLERLGLREAR